MTRKQYLAALNKLGLTPSGEATMAALGISLRQCQRLATGDRPVTPPVALLLAMYLKHGLPKWVREIADDAIRAMHHK